MPQLTEFDYDVRQRRALAVQARHRKCGSHGRKCSLPSDRLTNKQLKEMCSEVFSYNLYKPMGWKEFKGAPINIKREYVSGLIDSYGVNAAGLGKMFGVSGTTVVKYLKSNGVDCPFHVGHSMTKAQREKWDEFIGASDDPADDITIYHEMATDNTDRFDAVNTERHGVEIEDVSPCRTDSKRMNMTEFTLKFSGDIDVQNIMNSLRFMLTNKDRGTVEVRCTLDSRYDIISGKGE